MRPGPAISAAMLTALLAACAGVGSSISQTDRAFLQASSSWDLDKNGVVTCDEWKRYAADLFKEADANRDGMLSRDEYTAMSRGDRLFELVGFGYFDQNGDGRIALAELVDKPNPAFAILDKDRDCRLTGDELPTYSGETPAQINDEIRREANRRR